MQQLTIFDVLDEAHISEPVHDPNYFEKKLREMVMDAVEFLGYEQYLHESTEIAISNVVTSDNNKYFPTGCAMIDIYLMSNKATGSIMLANKFALENHINWVEYRAYDHRYFKKYHHSMETNEFREKPNIVTLEHYRNLHFQHQTCGIWFSSVGEKHRKRMIDDFLSWGF